MSKLIAIGLSPNIDSSDVKLAIQLLSHPSTWFDDTRLQSVRIEMEKLLTVPASQIFPSISGRSALYDALQIFNIGADDEVILQAFNCVAVVNPIVWTGAKPIFADINRNSLNISLEDVKRKTTDRTKAIIVQHTFGLPVADVEKIIEYAVARNIRVIEDCAHALGARINGKSVGTYGDAAIFSFGRDKMISSVFGGVLVVKSLYIEKTRELYEIKKDVSKGWIRKQLMHPLITYLSLLETPWREFGKLLHFGAKKTGLVSKATSSVEKTCGPKPEWIDKKMPGALASLAVKQLTAFTQSKERREQIARCYMDEGITCPQSNVEGRVWLRYPVLVDKPEVYHAEYKNIGIIIGDWYDQVVGPKEVDLKNTGYEKGMCPVAEEISGRIINLPVYPRMTNDEVEKVIGVFKSCRV